ncbi:MAG TPA: hypothetical protein DIV86_06425 [Alphaproteobacteria bacterium]|nr:hypothetical protein [Alphaproteobacteria bacterium]
MESKNVKYLLTDNENFSFNDIVLNKTYSGTFLKCVEASIGYFLDRYTMKTFNTRTIAKNLIEIYGAIDDLIDASKKDLAFDKKAQKNKVFKNIINLIARNHNDIDDIMEKLERVIIPKDKNWDRYGWSVLASNHDFERFILDIIDKAPDIENILKEKASNKKIKDFQKNDLMDALLKLDGVKTEVITYLRKLNLKESQIVKTLEILKLASNQDNIPNLYIKSDDIEGGIHNIEIIKVEKGHPRNLWVAREMRQVNPDCPCCAELGFQNSLRFLRAHVESPNMGLFVVKHKNQVIAKISVYLGTSNEIVFNAFEPASDEYNKFLKPVVTSLAKNLVIAKPETKSVYLGSSNNYISLKPKEVLGGNNPDIDSRTIIIPKDVVSSSDSWENIHTLLTSDQIQDILRKNNSKEID